MITYEIIPTISELIPLWPIAAVIVIFAALLIRECQKDRRRIFRSMKGKADRKLEAHMEVSR